MSRVEFFNANFMKNKSNKEDQSLKNEAIAEQWVLLVLEQLKHKKANKNQDKD